MSKVRLGKTRLHLVLVVFKESHEDGLTIPSAYCESYKMQRESERERRERKREKERGVQEIRGRTREKGTKGGRAKENGREISGWE